MKNYCVLLIVLLLAITKTIAQSNAIDSLKRELSKITSDQVRFRIYNDLGDLYNPWFATDSAMYFYRQADEIAKRNDQPLLHALCVTKIAVCTGFLQGVLNTFDSIQKGFDLAQDRDVLNGKYWDFRDIAPSTLQLSMLGWLNWQMGHLQRDQLSNINESITHFHHGRNLAIAAKDTLLLSFCNGSIMFSFIRNNMPDSALIYGRALEQTATYSISNNIFSYFPTRPDKDPFYIKDIGIAYLKLNNKPAFLEYLWRAIDFANKEDNIGALLSSYQTITEFYLSQQNKDSSFYYAKKAQQVYPDYYMVYENLYKCYELKNEPDSVAKYMKLLLADRKATHESQLENGNAIQRTLFQKQLQLQALEKEKIENEGQWKTFSIVALIFVFSIIGFLLYRNSRRQRKARTIIERSYKELKATQAQLIQSEKMASLGELTAGIAHEIQNPLNFVNNFSDVNRELVEELRNEMATGNIQMANEIAGDIKANEEKINLHGKRADAIVKSMLQHSRSSSGKKELTDINALADEYSRLAFHGLRAKDKSFNAKFETDFDAGIGKVNVIPQEIGRVVLNLINNAFYAVTEKKEQNTDGYEPVVTITTKKENGRIQIKVRDNGNGIPQNVLNKIFQPFFTTKPTGQGTGLGLSLSYDIVKAHGGELKVATKEGEGSEFDVQLPIK